MKIFQQIDPPSKQARLKINREATWYTWSPDFRCLFKAWNEQVEKLRSPVSIHLLRGKEYDDTYSIPISLISDKVLLRDLLVFAEDLYALEIGDQLMLFTGLIDEDLCSRSLRYLLAFLRAALVYCSGDPLSALCQPISRSQKTGKEFPLHSDLYIPAILFNVFDDAENDSSGASLFLSVASVIELLGSVKSLPDDVRQRITANLTRMHDRDCYEENYDLLHGCAHKWTQDLEQRMTRRQSKIKLYCGQGYMIHDRKWLHGRESLRGKLSTKRLHRLIFNTKQTQCASIASRSQNKSLALPARKDFHNNS
ncbi:MAG: hypothetical protein AABM67_07130 [Acidobacteriota bacterium]